MANDLTTKLPADFLETCDVTPDKLDILDKLNPGNIRNYADIQDLASMLAASVLLGTVDRRDSKEIRGWADVMYSCAAAQEGTKDGAGTTLVQQLIQMSTQIENPTVDIIPLPIAVNDE